MSLMRILTTIATAAGLATAAAPARSQEIPNLNIDPVCRGIAQQATTVAEKGAVDLAFSQCVQGEQAMRQKLSGEWSTFSPGEKANCIGAQMAGMASYTDLITCLEMARDARQLNQNK